MELIESVNDDEQLVLERMTDHVKRKTEVYDFEKDGDQLRFVGFADDQGNQEYPPEIPDRVKEEIEERREKEIVEPPIYGVECTDCGHPTSTEVEVEEDDRGYETPVNDTTEVKCPMCGEVKEMKIYKSGLSIGGTF